MNKWLCELTNVVDLAQFSDTKRKNGKEENFHSFRNTLEMSQQWWLLYQFGIENVDQEFELMSVDALKVRIGCRCL